MIVSSLLYHRIIASFIFTKCVFCVRQKLFCCKKKKVQNHFFHFMIYLWLLNLFSCLRLFPCFCRHRWLYVCDTEQWALYFSSRIRLRSKQKQGWKIGFKSYERKNFWTLIYELNHLTIRINTSITHTTSFYDLILYNAYINSLNY